MFVWKLPQDTESNISAFMFCFITDWADVYQHSDRALTMCFESQTLKTERSTNTVMLYNASETPW